MLKRQNQTVQKRRGGGLLTRGGHVYYILLSYRKLFYRPPKILFFQFFKEGQTKYRVVSLCTAWPVCDTWTTTKCPLPYLYCKTIETFSCFLPVPVSFAAQLEFSNTHIQQHTTNNHRRTSARVCLHSGQQHQIAQILHHRQP